MRRLLTALCLAALATGPALAQEARTFGDWEAACRDDNYCVASSNDTAHGELDGMPAYSLWIGRHAEQTYWEIAFISNPGNLAPSGEFVVSVDMEPEVFTLGDTVRAYGSPRNFYFLDDGAQAVMDRLVPGSKATVDVVTLPGRLDTAHFSLKGLAAAMLWIDEQQSRVGGERVASAAPYGLGLASENGASSPQVPAALLERHRADPECRPLEDLPNGSDIVTDTLDDKKNLYILPCEAGAYNFLSKVYVDWGYGEDDPATYEVMKFADYSSLLGWTGTTMLTNLDYDPETKQLFTFAKGRGIGDCGSIGTWTWAEYGFRLDEFRYKGECDATGGEDEEMPEFPVIYTFDGEAAGASQR